MRAMRVAPMEGKDGIVMLIQAQGVLLHMCVLQSGFVASAVALQQLLACGLQHVLRADQLMACSWFASCEPAPLTCAAFATFVE